jgi:hypothetical protein
MPYTSYSVCAGGSARSARSVYAAARSGRWGWDEGTAHGAIGRGCCPRTTRGRCGVTCGFCIGCEHWRACTGRAALPAGDGVGAGGTDGTDGIGGIDGAPLARKGLSGGVEAIPRGHSALARSLRYLLMSQPTAAARGSGESGLRRRVWPWTRWHFARKSDSFCRK